VTVIDEPADRKYPMPAMSAHRDGVFVGRIRVDDTIENGLNLWIVADNVRKGAALNAVQIAELIVKMKLTSTGGL
jgi:aspartate-semialdehyde dehydrogenase